MANSSFSYQISKYFSEYLPLHIGASKNTIEAYRDAFVQLLEYKKKCSNIRPDHFDFDSITREDVENFLIDIEQKKGVCIATRNQRLAAIHSFYAFLQRKEPACFDNCSKILAIPFKKAPVTVMTYMSVEEIRLLLSLPYSSSKMGLRDLTILSFLYETGARVQELIDLKESQIRFNNATVDLHGKGNKDRQIPIGNSILTILKKYIEVFHINPTDIVFRNRQEKPLTRAGVQYIVSKYVKLGQSREPTFFLEKRITNHTFRHSKAMHMLEAGVNLIYIRDFLGHSSVTTTEIYAKINPNIKRKFITENASLFDIGKRYGKQEKEDLIGWLKKGF